MELTALATPCRAPTRDFAGSDAHGKVIIASRWRAFSTGLFFTGYVMFSDIVGILYQRYKIYDIFISFFQKLHFYVF
jgi:hypothetical protein